MILLRVKSRRLRVASVFLILIDENLDLLSQFVLVFYFYTLISNVHVFGDKSKSEMDDNYKKKATYPFIIAHSEQKVNGYFEIGGYYLRYGKIRICLCWRFFRGGMVVGGACRWGGSGAC
jgi:hypothetical protein